LLSVDVIPDALRMRPQWVAWRYETRPGPGEPKPTKVPYNPRHGGKASSTDPGTWSTFDNVVLAADNGYDGIGFVFAADDEVVGVDLDHCRNPETGSIEAWAIEILGETRSYTEVSPSGTGLHVFLRGRLPAGARKRGPVEIYDRGRYFTVTGQRLEELPADIREPVVPLLELHAKLFPTGEPSATEPVVANLSSVLTTHDLDDQILLERARAATNGAKFSALWTGDVTGYPSSSEADLALCAELAFWTGRDPDRIDRLFRQSGLMRTKWDERHGATTYGARTIARAAAGCREVYGDRTPRPGDPAPRATGQTPAPEWTLWDGAMTWNFPPPQPLIDGLLMLEGVTWVGGRPKSFKSLLVHYLCLCIAAHRPAAAGHFKVQATPRILYVGREDGGARFALRRDEILAVWGCRPEAGAIRFLIREPVDLLNDEHIAWIRDACRRENITLLVLDTWTALSPGADPMAPKDQAQLAAVVVQLAQDIGGHVIVIDHSRKNRPDGQPLSSADIFGPLQKWAAADNTIMLERVGSSNRIEVFVEGKDMDSSQCFLEVSPRGSGREKFTYAGTVAELADAQRAIGDQNRQAIRHVVVNSAFPISKEEVTSQLLAQRIKLSAKRSRSTSVPWWRAASCALSARDRQRAMPLR
jgi:putative DNA primase/helicase